MEINRGALLVEMNGKLHQVTLGASQLTIIMELAAKMCGGELPILEDPIEGIYLPQKENGK